MAAHFLLKCGDGDIAAALGTSEYTLKEQTIDIHEVESILQSKGYTVSVVYDFRVRVKGSGGTETDNRFVKLTGYKGDASNSISIDVSPSCDTAHQLFGMMAAFNATNGANLYENLMYTVVESTIDDLEEILQTHSIVFNVADARFE